jgi:hypothetical protein
VDLIRFGLELDPMAGRYEHGNEPLNIIEETQMSELSPSE